MEESDRRDRRRSDPAGSPGGAISRIPAPVAAVAVLAS
jgi:hypothetical protein